MDEHVPPLYREQLLSVRPDLVVWRIGTVGAPPLGTSDPEILIWCESNNFILVTNNRRSMPVHLADHLSVGNHIPGIITIDLDAPIGIVVEELIIISEAALEDELRDRIEYVPLS
jgi:hypothetical protein